MYYVRPPTSRNPLLEGKAKDVGIFAVSAARRTREEDVYDPGTNEESILLHLLKDVDSKCR